MLIPDTTAYSLLHRLAGYHGLESPPLPKVKIYLATVTVIYLPLAIVALLSALSITELNPEHRELDRLTVSTFRKGLLFVLNGPGPVRDQLEIHLSSLRRQGLISS